MRIKAIMFTMLAAFVLLAVAAFTKAETGGAQGNGTGQYDKEKVLICHKPGTPAQQELLVPAEAVPGHLGHGDTLGPCPPPQTIAEPPGTTVVTPPETTGGGTTVINEPPGTTVVTPPENTTPGTTVVDEPTATTPILPAVELHYICTSDGVDRFAVKNLSNEAVEVTFEDATGQQTFTVEAQGYYLIDGKVSQGSLPVAKLYFEGTLVDEVSVTFEACEVTTPPEDTTEDTTGGTTDIQDIGEPTNGETTNGATEPTTEKPDTTGPDGETPPGTPDSGGPDAPAASDGDTPSANGAGAGEGDGAAGSGGAGGAGAVPDAGPDVVDRVEGGALPDTGGPMLPFAALGAGALLIGYRIMRRL